MKGNFTKKEAKFTAELIRVRLDDLFLQFQPVGSLARKQNVVGDVDLLGSVDGLRCDDLLYTVQSRLSDLPMKVTKVSENILNINSPYHVPVDLFLCANHSFGSNYFFFSQTKNYNIEILWPSIWNAGFTRKDFQIFHGNKLIKHYLPIDFVEWYNKYCSSDAVTRLANEATEIQKVLS